MSFRVVVTERAEKDLQSIGDWLRERSADGAAQWTLAAWKAINSLHESAGFCPRAPENEHVVPQVRNILFRTRKGRVYRAVFIIDGDCVIVTHVRGPGQDIIPSAEFNRP